ncbi:type I-B CRISPR-associated protein Cas7/Cst2/DevR [Geobacillus subterraneus]|uniref:type I-B CRISPR-associated protein Cas7/Cst2/DevR n=1 Tax=Geobacillus subterraneus TaxID=129338 RepID=UPI002AC95E4E|nr:type I-B CRISPR-associated protein Cas7/Cst2/DevR [Geobacillus subterraneus]WPZ19208.1 type I-B CRISPR-associated protein Cas7/Cst2/DevR [Geobacillus subterraneus]
MNKKGLTASFIFEAESANYGESVGNVAALKKISRGTGEAYTYISRQALRYNIIEQMGVAHTPLDVDGKVIQFHPDATIQDYPEIDLFGYMKTKKPARTRAAVVRLSNAIALESFRSDMDFLTNKGLLDRYNQCTDEMKEGGNIAQSEIHKSYYTYTIAVDLNKVGIDPNDGIEITNEEKTARIHLLLDTIKFLYRDIKGRRENLSPLFAIGGVYDVKNPFFENKIKVVNNRLQIDPIESVLCLDEHVREKTRIGYMKGIFDNDREIEETLAPVSIREFFAYLKEEVSTYYLR